MLKASFQSMQGDVVSAIDGLTTSTETLLDKDRSAHERDNTWFNCVGEEREMLEKVEDADTALEASRSAVTEPCHLQADRAPYSSGAVDIPSFDCDISQEGNCDNQLQNFKT